MINENRPLRTEYINVDYFREGDDNNYDCFVEDLKKVVKKVPKQYRNSIRIYFELEKNYNDMCGDYVSIKISYQRPETNEEYEREMKHIERMEEIDYEKYLYLKSIFEGKEN
jgi:hypothetical protein